MTAPIRMHIESTPDHLPVVRGAVKQMCRTIGFADDDVARVVAAVDEALTNIIKHAYQGQAGRPIDIELSYLSDGECCCGIEVVLTARGRVVPIEDIHGRDLADIRPGGLGTHIMGCCADAVEYTHPAEGGTQLRLRKYLNGPPPAEDEGQTRDG